MVGTIVNTCTVIAGSMIGMAINKRLPAKIVDIIFQGLGLFTIAIGISMSLQSGNFVLIVISIVLGAVTGQYLGISTSLDKFSKYLNKRSKDMVRREDRPEDSAKKFSEGFITASMLFCVGSMSILGAFEDGTGQTPTLLYTKSIMDGVSSVALASSFGIAIAFSAIPMFVYQGLLTLFAAFIMQFMSEAMVADMTATGGILLIGLGINILKIKNIDVINMLPALVYIVLLSYFFA